MVTLGLLLILALIAAMLVIVGAGHGYMTGRDETTGIDREPLEPPRTDSGSQPR